MFGNEEDRGPPSSLRGWLSEVYFPAILDGAREALSKRLGARATLDDPVLGRAAGMPALEQHLQKTEEWLNARKAKYLKGAFSTGIDRDVAEGILSLSHEGAILELPVAVVAERRKSREVELRVYHSRRLLGQAEPRARLVPTVADLTLPKLVNDNLDALRAGAVDAALETFESDGHLVDGAGRVHAKGDGTLRSALARMVGAGQSPGFDVQRGGYADGGRTCALEYTLVRLAGKDVPPSGGLAIYERGDNGLIRALRFYDDAF